MRKLSNNFSGEEKTVAKNYGALVVLQGLNYLLPLLTIPFLERVLGIDKFGLVMFAQSFMIFCLVITDFGFNYTASREIADLRIRKADFSDLYFKVFWAKLALTVFTFLLLLLLVFSFERFRVNWEVYILSFGVVIGHSLFPLWFFQGIEKMRVVTITNVIAKSIFVILLFIYVKLPEDFLRVPLFNSIGFIIGGIISFIISLRYVTYKRPSFNSGLLFYKQSFQAFVANSATTLYTSANIFILGLFAGDVLVGVFASFEKIILACKNMFTPIYQALLPYLSRIEANRRDSIIYKLFFVVVILGLLMVVCFNIFGEDILAFLYNDPLILEYAYLFKLMTWIALFSGISMLYMVLYAPILKQYGKIMTVTLVVGVLSLLSCLILIPNYKIVASAVIMFGTEFLLCIIATFLLIKNMTINKRIKSIR